MKRVFDLLAGLLAFLFLAPVMVLVAILIKCHSPGPVLFRQIRVGRGGGYFHIFKFRTMVVNAAELGPYFTRTDDPRITPIGRLLRKTSLDELPQILNVLLGDMSIVGPRPDVPIQRDYYTQKQWDKRHRVRPGITGLAQALKRSAATPEERIYLDLEYVNKASIAFDAYVILLTVKQLLFARGSN